MRTNEFSVHNINRHSIDHQNQITTYMTYRERLKRKGILSAGIITNLQPTRAPRSILVHYHRIQDVSDDLEDSWQELKLVCLPSLETSAEVSPAVDEAYPLTLLLKEPPLPILLSLATSPLIANSCFLISSFRFSSCSPSKPLTRSRTLPELPL
jgi:hypothetical protein